MHMDPDYRVVKGGGLSFMTSDPFLIAAVKRCAELEAQLRQTQRALQEAQHVEVARFRTLRRNMTTVKKSVQRLERASVQPSP